MLSTEREEFDKQLAVLFGGFPKAFLTTERKEAYWRGLEKMPLSAFVRCVNFVLGDNGIDDLPPVNRIWQISRDLRARTHQSDTQKPTPQFDDYHMLAARWLFAYLLKQGGVDPVKLPKLIAAKNRIVEQFRSTGNLDGNVAEWLDVAMATFEREAA